MSEVARCSITDLSCDTEFCWPPTVTGSRFSANILGMNASHLHKSRIVWIAYHGGHSPTAFETIAPSRLRRRAGRCGEHRIQGSSRTRYCRNLSELCERLRGVEGKSAAHGRQRGDALFHRAFAPAARP